MSVIWIYLNLYITCTKMMLNHFNMHILDIFYML